MVLWCRDCVKPLSSCGPVVQRLCKAFMVLCLEIVSSLSGLVVQRCVKPLWSCGVKIVQSFYGLVV